MTVFALLPLLLASCYGWTSREGFPVQRPNSSDSSPQYQLVKLKRKNQTLPPIVQGRLTGGIDQIPLQIGVVKTGSTLLSADRTGTYRWQGQPGAYRFLARSVGFADVQSEKVRLAMGDSVRLDFQLPIGPPITHRKAKNN